MPSGCMPIIQHPPSPQGVLFVFHRFQLIPPYRDGKCLVKIVCPLDTNNSAVNTHFCKEEDATSPLPVIWRLSKITGRVHCIRLVSNKCPWLWVPSVDDSAFLHLPGVSREWDPLRPLRVKVTLTQACEASKPASCPFCHCSGPPPILRPIHLSTSSLCSSQQTYIFRKVCILTN